MWHLSQQNSKIGGDFWTNPYQGLPKGIGAGAGKRGAIFWLSELTVGFFGTKTTTSWVEVLKHDEIPMGYPMFQYNSSVCVSRNHRADIHVSLYTDRIWLRPHHHVNIVLMIWYDLIIFDYDLYFSGKTDNTHRIHGTSIYLPLFTY